MTPPEQCETLAEIRDEMDSIDLEIIGLLARRVRYVRAAAKFKISADTVAAPDRVRKVLDSRREWAAEAGLSSDVVETLYREIVAYCVGEEKKEWDAMQIP